MNKNEIKAPTPFIRWAGGKRRLCEAIVESFPKNFEYGTNKFFEPFLGGGALSFYLGNQEKNTYVPGINLYINDTNPDLVTTYVVIRDNLDKLIHKLHNLAQDTSKNRYESIRNLKPKSDIEIAARFIYLNKTCFNGLWRVNSKGEFNVPWGKLKNPSILDVSNLKLVSKRLQSSTITNLNYTSAVANATSGDLVYFDPPYIPINSTSSFSKYSKEDFGIMDQYALSGVIDGLTARGVYVILSNSDTNLTRQIFGQSLNLHQVTTIRTISAKASSRKIIKELIGLNYKIPNSSALKGLKVVS